MKRITIFGLLGLLLCLSIVSAGNSTEVSFDVYETQGVYLYEHDEVRFNLLGDEHSIIIEDVGTSSIKLDIAMFLNDDDTATTPALVGMDYISKLDLDRDGITDLNIALYSIDKDGRVMLILQDVTQSDPSDEITGNIGLVDNGSTVDSSFNKNYILIGLGVIVLGLVIFLIFKNSKGSEPEPRIEDPESAEPSDNK